MTALPVILDRVDAAVGRDQAGDTELMLAQTFATVWAVIGWAVWTVLWLAVRLAALIGRAVASPWRRRRDRADDEQWTTTMKRRGRPR